MRSKALILTLFMVLSSLAGCLEGIEGDDSNSDDGVIVDDRSGNGTSIPSSSTDILVEEDRAGVDSDNSTETPGLTDEVYLAYFNANDCNDGGGDWTEPSERGGDSYCSTSDQEVLDRLKGDCERRGGNFTAPNSTADRGKDNGTGGEQTVSFEVVLRGCMMPGDTVVDLTEEECQREGGDWNNGCIINRNHGSESHHHLVVVYPDNSSEVMPCRGCTGLENMTGWNLTTAVLNEWNISFNYSTLGKYTKTITAINGSDSSNGSSWHWTHYIWNETDGGNASWEESRTGIDAIMLGNHTNHIAWAPNSTHTSDIPAPRLVVDNEETEPEMTEEDCKRRGGTWTEAPEREGEHFCDYGEEDREEEQSDGSDREEEQGDDREEESDGVSR